MMINAKVNQNAVLQLLESAEAQSLDEVWVLQFGVFDNITKNMD